MYNINTYLKKYPRTKYLDVEETEFIYRKQHKHTENQNYGNTRRELKYLNRILKEIRRTKRVHEDTTNLLKIKITGSI